MAKKVTVDFASFERSHGKRPRGSGRWVFWFGFEPSTVSFGPEVMDRMFTFTGSFSEAAKAAKAAAQERGESRVVVGA